MPGRPSGPPTPFSPSAPVGPGSPFCPGKPGTPDRPRSPVPPLNPGLPGGPAGPVNNNDCNQFPASRLSVQRSRRRFSTGQCSSHNVSTAFQFILQHCYRSTQAFKVCKRLGSNDVDRDIVKPMFNCHNNNNNNKLSHVVSGLLQ